MFECVSIQMLHFLTFLGHLFAIISFKAVDTVIFPDELQMKHDDA